MVEAVGTFIDDYSSPGQIDALGTHGFHLWSDPYTGEESFDFIACWTRRADAARPGPARPMRGCELEAITWGRLARRFDPGSSGQPHGGATGGPAARESA